MKIRFAILLATLVAAAFPAARADSLPTLYDQYLDLADQDAVDYVTGQLTAAGISETDYPTLYSTLQQSPALYALANSLGINIPETVIMGAGTTSLQPIYFTVPSYATSTNTVSAESATSIPNDPTTTVQTIGIYSGETAVADPMGDVTVGGTATLMTGVSGTALTGVTDYTAEGASTFIYPATVLGDTVMTELGLTADDDIALSQAANFPFSTISTTVSITNTNPVDTKNVGYILVCLVRNQSNCSYSFPKVNGQWIVQLPLTGSATFGEAIATDPTTGQPTDAQYQVAIYYPDVGGGCTMPDTDFAEQVTISGSTINWNANPAQFGTVCSEIPYGQTVDVVYQLTILLTGVDGSPLMATVTSQQGATVANVYRTEPMEFIYGCLAPGSLITLADGTTRTVEEIKVGDLLKGLDGRSLEVTGYTMGPETGHLYVVTTADGHTVSMTERHPVPLADGTVKVGADLMVGDQLTTANGASAIAAIAEQPYDGQVWNLMVGHAQRSRTAVDTAAHTFFANGILVGDAVAQAHYNIVRRNSPEEILKTLPDRWRHDFDSAQKRNRTSGE